MYGKGFLGNMTENLHADCVQSRQAGFMQCFLHMFMAAPHKTVRRTLCSVSFKHALVPGQTLMAIPHKDCATDASSNFSSDETKSGVNT